MSRTIWHFYSFKFHRGKAFIEKKVSCKLFDTLTYNRIIRFNSLHDYRCLRLQENYLYCQFSQPNTQCRETIAILFAAAASFTTRWASFHPFLLWGCCDVSWTPSGMYVRVCTRLHEFLQKRNGRQIIILRFIKIVFRWGLNILYEIL